MNWKNICASLIGVSMLTLAVPAFADDDPGPAAYSKAMTGKRVVLVPMAMGFDLAQGWFNTSLNSRPRSASHSGPSIKP